MVDLSRGVGGIGNLLLVNVDPIVLTSQNQSHISPIRTSRRLYKSISRVIASDYRWVMNSPFNSKLVRVRIKNPFPCELIEKLQLSTSSSFVAGRD